MARILVVEDEAHIARVMSLWLTRHGHSIVEACNGQVALDILAGEAVDMIISDVNMPELDGLELARVVRIERRLDTPFLLLSARCDQDSLCDRVRPYGVRLYPKPFVPSRLVADIEAMLGGVSA